MGGIEGLRSITKGECKKEGRRINFFCAKLIFFDFQYLIMQKKVLEVKKLLVGVT